MSVISSFIGGKGGAKESDGMARIVEDHCQVCTIDDKGRNCYDPNSLRDAFRPLAIYAKLFGLFPCYNLSFVENLNENRIKLIHIIDYCYTGIVFCSMAGCALVCAISPPSAFKRLRIDYLDGTNGDDDPTIIDFYVSLAACYMTLLTGVMALFTFPRSNGALLNLLRLFSQLDKILRFDGRLEERIFARRLLIHLIVIFLLTIGAYVGFYIFEPSSKGEIMCFTDFMITPILAFCGTALLIPTALLIFFLNALQLRLFHFNKFMESTLKSVTASYTTCNGYSDWNVEKELKVSTEQMAVDMALHVEKLRLLYIEIVALSSEMSCLFGLHLVRDYLFSTLGLVLYAYILLFVDYGGSPSNYVIVSSLEVFLLMKLYLMSTYAQSLICSGQLAKKMLNRVSILRVSPECASQIQMFLNAIEANPVAISAAGYFTINRQLLTSLSGAITTYFIILIQFKFDEMKDDMRENIASLLRRNASEFINIPRP